MIEQSLYPGKGDRVVKPATAINLSQRVVLLVEQLQAFLDTVAGQEPMKSCTSEALEEQIQMIWADAAMSGRVRKPNIRVGVILFNKCPKPLQPP